MLFVDFSLADIDHLSLWSPPPGVFTKHEASALLRHSPFVDVYKRISVQGFEFIGYSPMRNYDSSASWVSTVPPFLARVLRFFEVASCCHPDCEVELVAEVLRFEAKQVSRSMPGDCIAMLKENQAVEYVSASSLLPQVLVLLPLIKTAPVSRREKRVAAKTIQRGPFLVLSLENKQYQ